MKSDEAVFRKVALDRLSSPEQLDKLLQVTRPRGWIALVALGFLVGSAVLWGFEGSIPSRVAGQGILLKSGGVLEITAGAEGRITDLAIGVGDVVREGQVVARVAQPRVLDRIRQVRLALDNLRVEQRMDATHVEEETVLQLARLRQRREGLERSIAAEADSLRWQQERVDAQQQLVDQGRLTRRTVIDSRRQMLVTEERLRANRHQLAELGIEQLALETRNARNRQASEHEMAQATAELEQLEREMTSRSEIVSTFNGRILEILAETGDVVVPGQPLLRLDRSGRTVKGLEAVIYVPSADGKRILTGMEVRIAPSSVAPEEHGYMLGTVTYVSDFPTTSRAIQRTLRNPELVSALSRGDAPYEIRVDLQIDPSTFSGYRWSSSSGPPIDILTGTLCAATITVARRRPVDMVIPFVREQFGMQP